MGLNISDLTIIWAIVKLFLKALFPTASQNLSKLDWWVRFSLSTQFFWPYAKLIKGQQ